MKTIRTLLIVALAAATMVACGSKSPSPMSFPLVPLTTKGNAQRQVAP